MTSSLPKPDFEDLDQYTNLSELYKRTKEVPIQKERLENIHEIKPLIF